jgi:hypothetical protein
VVFFVLVWFWFWFWFFSLGDNCSAEKQVCNFSAVFSAFGSVMFPQVYDSSDIGF